MILFDCSVTGSTNDTIDIASIAGRPNSGLLNHAQQKFLVQSQYRCILNALENSIDLLPLVFAGSSAVVHNVSHYNNSLVSCTGVNFKCHLTLVHFN